MIKKYTNGKITIIWEPERCWHSGNCVTHLPQVFRPAERLWIRMDGSSTENIAGVIEKCPSGALSYFLNKP